MENLENILQLRSLKGDFERLYNSVAAGGNCMVFNLPRPARAHIASHLDKFILYITPNDIESAKTLIDLTSYYGDAVMQLSASDDQLIYRKTFHKSNIASRIKTLRAVLSGECKALVATIQSISQFLPMVDRLRESILTIQIGQSYDIYEVIKILSGLGFIREDAIEEKNTFCLVGDILSVFPAESDLPIRISFFDDQAESIKYFEPESRMSTRQVNAISFYPSNDLLWTAEEIAYAAERAEKQIGTLSPASAERAREILFDVTAGGQCSQKCQWLIPFLKSKMSTIFDFLPKNSLIVLDEPSSINSALEVLIEENIARAGNLTKDGDCLTEHKNILLDKQSLYRAFDKQPKLGFAKYASTNLIFSPDSIYSFDMGTLGNYNVVFKTFFDDVKAFVVKGFSVVVCAGDDYKAKAIAASLKEENIAANLCNKIDVLEPSIYVTPLEISRGFVYNSCKLVVVGREDIYRQRLIKEEKKNKVFTIPKVGDFVVHEVHGIGKCLGTNRVKTGDIEQDYVIVEYSKQEKLYVPIDQLDRLSRYSGSDREPRLSQIGGKDFEKVKAAVKRSVKEMAINLVELYAKRQKKSGHKYEKDTDWQRQFENSFEFDETPDQLQAIEDFKSDMERGIIMDRLLCGDVGFGKTEVALRAIFKTILENKQAVILAPTTILARQHYMTAMRRFAEFDLKVELLTRFQTPEQINQSLNNIATGRSLIAIGTHRVLSSDVQFNDLGLLVLDEEQRFGVEHKEKLKLLKNNVNVLTMSATPIPRTLNMALTGIRDISVLETPPHNRIPVQTSVNELTDGLLQDAITRELARNGQVFVLYNRVDTIDKMAARIEQVAPDAKIVVAHGQMDTRQLEDRINAFYNKDVNVLVCSTIIENGIDIPDANTLIVCDSDRLGLSQLYQLRGRVGRSERLAYAYFTIPPSKVLSENSMKRLNAIMDYTELGSGFKIAMRDLEIRGAGNILGKEQHGHIEKVGYEMYCKLLRESVNELQGNPTISDRSVKINVDIDAYLDASYIPSENQRLKTYKEIAAIASLEEKQTFIKVISDNYGQLPTELVNLIDIALMKNIAKTLEICQIDAKIKGAGFTFESGNCYKNEAFMRVVDSYGKKCMLTYEDTPKLLFDCKWLGNVEKFTLLRDFLFKVGGSL